MNADSPETKRLADAVASVAATMAEMFNEKLKAAAAGSCGAVITVGEPTAKSAEYPRPRSVRAPTPSANMSTSSPLPRSIRDHV